MTTNAPRDLDSIVSSARRQSPFELVRRNAGLIPDKTAIEHEDRTWSYGELVAASRSVAAGLRRLGVKAGDRVAAYGHNSDWYVIYWLGVQALGAVHVPINFMLTGREVQYILQDSEAVVLAADVHLLGPALQAVGDSGITLGTFGAGEAAGAVFAVENLARSRDAFDETTVEGVTNESVAQLAYTSGTEGVPKGVMLSTAGLISEYVSCVQAGRYTDADVVVHALPLYHCAQLHCFLMPYLYLGAHNIILKGANPSLIQTAVEAKSATSFFAAPTVWISLLRSPDFDASKFGTLTKGYYGASIMPLETIRELSEVLPQLQLWNYYGQTELGPLATVLQPEDAIRKPGSAGRPVLNVETRVTDDRGEDVAPGEIGEIIHRSAQATLGYWNLPEKTAETFAGGWFHSGDLGVLDGDGYLTIVDRKKDMINSGGENVASREVEDAIYLHPGVAEVAVIGLSHEKWIETVAAVIVVKQGAALTEEEVMEFSRTQLAPFKTPKIVHFVEQLPKNPSGKILKRDLRERFSD